MKKQLLKLGAICFALAIGGNAIAQEAIKTTTFLTTPTAPEIDGVADALWAGVEKLAIERAWPDQSISMSEGAPTVQVCWDADNTYVLVTVPDDHCFTSTESGQASWLSDKPEIYFDVNADKVEDPAVGPSTSGSGHYQFAPDFTQAEGGDGTGTAPTNHTVALTIDGDDAGYIFEYAIPHASMSDLDGAEFSPVDGLVIGFDVTILDLDADGSGANVAIGRANWSNDMLSAGESWADMTMSGDATYSSDEIVTGVKSIASKSNFSVYVNAGELNFSTKVTDVKVLNTIGQVVKTSTNVAGLNKGVYIVTAKNTKGQAVANRFVIK
jgi:hypothetical protein